MKRLLFIIVLLCSNSLFGQTYTARTGGNWSDNTNVWSLDGGATACGCDPGNAPANTVSIVIDCTCAITNDAGNIDLDGSLTIGTGSSLDGGNSQLDLSGDDNATITNNGTVTNFSDVKAQGGGILTEGPFVTNNNIMTVTRVSRIGNNDGGGILTNASGATLTVTGGDLHVDGTVDNEGNICVTGEVLFHGAIVSGGGDFEVKGGNIEFREGGGMTGGAAGGAPSIQSQSFSDGAGCTGASSSTPVYLVSGGAGGGPNGDDTYTYQQLLDEFGLTHTEFILGAGVRSCNESAASALPVELISFTGENDNGRVKLNWVTASEVNNDRFEVEHSTDGSSFVNIGTVGGNGNSNEVISYEYMDPNPSPLKNYYRLRQVDYDGRFEYSPTIVVFQTNEISSGWKVYPTTVEDNNLTIQSLVGIEAHTFYQIVDLKGQVVITRSLPITTNTTSLSVDVTGLQPGMYILQINMTGRQMRNRFFVARQ